MPQSLPAPHITLTEEEANDILDYEDEYDGLLYKVETVDVISDNKHETYMRYIIRRKNDDTLWESVYLSGSAYSSWEITGPESFLPAFLQIDEIKPVPHYSLHGITF